MRLTIGGGKLEYDKETASPAANLLDTKLLLNSTILDAHKGARFMSLDIKDCFLMNTLPVGEQECMRIHSKYFYSKIKNQYNLHDKINNNECVYCEVETSSYTCQKYD